MLILSSMSMASTCRQYSRFILSSSKMLLPLQVLSQGDPRLATQHIKKLLVDLCMPLAWSFRSSERSRSEAGNSAGKVGNHRTRLLYLDVSSDFRVATETVACPGHVLNSKVVEDLQAYPHHMQISSRDLAIFDDPGFAQSIC